MKSLIKQIWDLLARKWLDGYAFYWDYPHLSLAIDLLINKLDIIWILDFQSTFQQKDTFTMNSFLN